MLAAAVLSCAAGAAADPDAHAIVRRAFSKDDSNARIARNYTFLERQEFREYDGEGAVKSRTVKTYDVTLVEGSPYRRLIRVDDRPLAAKEEQKEQERLSQSIAERQRETPERRAKRIAEWEARQKRVRAPLAEIADAFELQVAGEERREGRDLWVIRAVPRPGYRPRAGGMAKWFGSVQGMVWVDKSDYQWVRAEAEVLRTVSLGWLLARVAKGTRMSYERVRVNDEVWLPKAVSVNADARIALLKKFRGEMEVTYSEYRRFRAESRVVPGEPAGP